MILGMLMPKLTTIRVTWTAKPPSMTRKTRFFVA